MDSRRQRFDCLDDSFRIGGRAFFTWRVAEISETMHMISPLGFDYVRIFTKEENPIWISMSDETRRCSPVPKHVFSHSAAYRIIHVVEPDANAVELSLSCTHPVNPSSIPTEFGVRLVREGEMDLGRQLATKLKGLFGPGSKIVLTRLR